MFYTVLLICCAFISVNTQCYPPQCLQRPAPAVGTVCSPAFTSPLPVPVNCQIPFAITKNCITDCLIREPVECLPCGRINEIPFPDLMAVGMANPFMPLASPVSALVPSFSPLLPPVSTCNCRCEYLRKIPIPPPCI